LRAARVAVLLFFVAGVAQASPLELFGYGARSPGLVGTGVSTTSAYDSIYINPAGLAHVKRTHLAFGVLYGNMSLQIDESEIGTDPALGTSFGAAARLKLGGAMADRVSLGFGVFVPTAAIVRSRSPVTGNPTFAVLENRSQVVALQFGLGARITDNLNVGATILGLAGLGGNIFVSTDAAGRFTARSEQTMIARFSPILGAQYTLPKQRLELGLVFRAESDATFDVLVENDLINDLPLTIPTLNIGGVAQFDPLTVAAEASWRYSPNLRLTGYLSYNRWSEFEAPTFNPVPGQPAAPAPDFHDTVTPKIAAEWRALDAQAVVDVRGGYSFVMTPAPEMDGRQSLLDNHRHVASLGVGLAWPSVLPFRVDLWTQAHVLMSRTHTKDPSKFGAEDEMPFTQIETGGRVLVGGMSLGVDL